MSKDWTGNHKSTYATLGPVPQHTVGLCGKKETKTNP